ncbi:MAG: ABC transporter ATP-binding protein [Dictyoglomus thermophilum]|uniref:ABC transporter ATP-binding protein n=1 Tax=Dictyoglomus thermophilum TaxID=14 RepID=A0A7V4DXZ7_DICTH|nr:ABC transporter ATP-binding protein [Dictyoglomus thermophilum]MCX7720211.1 ABC transporter ATP-binding protein [Dictyoglomus thermophilum]TYT23324.1 ABC transporter ATP-binding protein [Dictyoglomus thermophilum]
MIKVENLYKYYPMGKEKYPALKNINLSINKGEFVAIIGPSGSGKSTLLNIIGGLDRPSEGKVYVDGQDIFKLNDARISKYRNKKIGFVFQFFYLEPTYTVLENVMLPLIFSKSNSRELKAKEAIEKVGLTHKIGNKGNELSGGERQRVAIARAIVNNPSLLLCDEPTGNLDSKTGISIMNLLKALNKEGKTIVLVTHNLEYLSFVDRVIKIKDGELEVN